jgi:hypothetical protein
VCSASPHAVLMDVGAVAVFLTPEFLCVILFGGLNGGNAVLSVGAQRGEGPQTRHPTPLILIQIKIVRNNKI